MLKTTKIFRLQKIHTLSAEYDEKSHYCIEDDNKVSAVLFSVISTPEKTMIMYFGAINGTYIYI